MPSGARRRKAKKKKQAQNQQHGNKDDSGNEQELENEHEQEQDHGQEEDPITPKTPVRNNEGEEKEKSGVEGASSDTEDVGFLDGGFNQNQDNRTQTSFQKVESTDTNLVIPENGGGRLENEFDISSGGAFEDKDGLIGNLDSLTGTVPARTLSSSSSSSSSSHQVRDNGDEIHHEEIETITDAGVIALGLHNGDENEVSSSKLLVSEENEPNQILGPLTNVNETIPKDNDDTQVEVEAAPSEELESSDGDESKLDVVSTMATLDADESIQSVGSVDSPRSVSHQCLDQVSNERAEFAVQDQDRGSEGFSEIPFQELGSKADFLNAEAGDKPVFKSDMEFLQEENGHQNSLSEESSKGLMNEENIQVSTEVVSDNYATVMEELTQVVAELEKSQVASSFSLADAIEKSEAIPKVDENDAKESVMHLSKSESVNTRHISVVSTSGEAVEKVVSVGEASQDVISSGGEAVEKVVSIGEASQDPISAGGEGKDGKGSINVQDTPTDPNEISGKEITSHPQNGTNEKKINLPQRESRTSWFNCCGLLDLFTSARS